MASVKVKKDKYGFYVRHAGCVFRPLYPIGFEPNNPVVDINEGMMVNATYKGAGASYAKVKVGQDQLFWMNHGSYIIPDGDDVIHQPSTQCIIVSTIPESTNV